MSIPKMPQIRNTSNFGNQFARHLNKEENSMKKQVSIILLIFLSVHGFCQERVVADITKVWEHYLMDFGWRFALGHPFDAQKDFDHGTAYFSYFAKTRY